MSINIVKDSIFTRGFLIHRFNAVSQNFYGPPRYRWPPRNPGEACAHFTLVSCGTPQEKRPAGFFEIHYFAAKIREKRQI